MSTEAPQEEQPPQEASEEEQQRTKDDNFRKAIFKAVFAPLRETEDNSSSSESPWVSLLKMMSIQHEQDDSVPLSNLKIVVMTPYGIFTNNPTPLGPSPARLLGEECLKENEAMFWKARWAALWALVRGFARNPAESELKMGKTKEGTLLLMKTVCYKHSPLGRVETQSHYVSDSVAELVQPGYLSLHTPNVYPRYLENEQKWSDTRTGP